MLHPAAAPLQSVRSDETTTSSINSHLPGSDDGGSEHHRHHRRQHTGISDAEALLCSLKLQCRDLEHDNALMRAKERVYTEGARLPHGPWGYAWAHYHPPILIPPSNPSLHPGSPASSQLCIPSSPPPLQAPRLQMTSSASSQCMSQRCLAMRSGCSTCRGGSRCVGRKIEQRGRLGQGPAGLDFKALPLFSPLEPLPPNTSTPSS